MQQGQNVFQLVHDQRVKKKKRGKGKETARDKTLHIPVLLSYIITREPTHSGKNNVCTQCISSYYSYDSALIQQPQY